MLNYEKYEKIISVREHVSIDADLMFIDIDDDGIGTFTTKHKLDKDIETNEVEPLLIEKIIDLSCNHDEDILEKFSINPTTNNRQAIVKIITASSYIATNGKIGTANTMLVSKENYDKYDLKGLDGKYDFFFDDNIDDIYLYRKNSFDQPGLVLVYFEHNYDIIPIGFYPEKQFLKIMIKN